MPEPKLWLGRLLLAAGLLLSALGAVAAPRIGVLTMGPGAEYWSRYGHNAILVEHEDGQRWVYNYGFFDFEQEDFLLRFMRGRMLYRLVRLPFERDLAYYAEEGRSVRLQWLDLDDQAAYTVANFVLWNAQPENAEYRYDYFVDNCSTRVRDVIDRALNGEFRRQTHGRSRGLTFRSEALRLAHADQWMYWGIHLLLSDYVDRALSRWEESFVPAHLHDALALVRLPPDGRPLVVAEEELLPQRIAPALATTPRYPGTAALVGAMLGALILFGAGHLGLLGRLSRSVWAVFCLISTVAGLVMLGLWLGTDHRAAWGNHNLWLFLPTSLLLLAALGPLRRAHPTPPWMLTLATVSVISSCVGFAMHNLLLRPQDNIEWLLFALPIHFAIWLRLRSTTGSSSR